MSSMYNKFSRFILSLVLLLSLTINKSWSQCSAGTATDFTNCLTSIAASGGSITLTGSFTLTGNINLLGKSFTLIVNGKDITFSGVTWVTNGNPEWTINSTPNILVEKQVGPTSFASMAAAGTLSAFIASRGAVLSIELVNFSVQATDSGNFLTWATTNEVNNKGFQIERKQPNSLGGDSWDILGFKTTNHKASTYQFLDVAPPLGAGVLYYRFRQIDFDGTEKLSKVISVAQKGKGKGLVIYPNPVASLLNIENTVEARNPDSFEKGANFQILNLLGQQVLAGKNLSGGRGLDVSALPQGTYILKVGAEQVKFLKQ
jgi:hypothetical protein